MQIGEAPIFLGIGMGDLVCRCGNSVLIKGYRPENFLAIRIRCARCGEVSMTPGLPSDELLPRNAIEVARIAQPSSSPSRIASGSVLVCEDAAASDYARYRPRTPPPPPMVLSAAMVEQVAAEYDRRTGGMLADHSAEAARADSLDATAYPFAWSVLRLRSKIDDPKWTWLHDNDDAMAAMHVASMQDWLDCWGAHPRLDWAGAAFGAPHCFLRTMAVFATARLLFESGNRVGFSLPDGNPAAFGLHFSAGDDALALAIQLRPELQWRARQDWSPAIVQAAIAEAVAASRGQVNLLHRGILVVPTSILLPDFDQAVVDATREVLRSIGRRYRHLAAIAAITPKIWPAQRPDQMHFFYGFYPLANPRFAGANPLRIGTAQDFAPSS